MVVLFVLLGLLCTWTDIRAQPATDERSLHKWSMLYPNSAVLRGETDLPAVFSNDLTTQIDIRSVACYVVGGTVTVLPVLTGRAATSLLKQPLVCQPNIWSAGVLNGTPLLRSFASNGVTCPVIPCTMDLNIETITGTPSYMIVKIVGRVPRGGSALAKKRR